MTMATDLDVLHELRPDDVVPSAAFLTDERARLLAHATREVAGPPRRVTRVRRSRVRRRWAVLPIAAVLAGATAVYAVTRSDDANPTRVACRFDAGTTSVVDATTGDPVADCTALWARTHAGAAPALRAYRVDGSVLVLRADADAPSGAEPLGSPAPSAADATAALTELEARLLDYASGLRSQPCVPFVDAVQQVEADVADLGLADRWTVRAEPPALAASCGLAFLAPETAEVVVRGVDVGRWTAERSAPSEVAVRDLAHAIAAAIADGCLPVDGAAARAREIADTAGYPMAVVRTVVDRDADCSRVTVTVGGSVDVVVRGPRRSA